MERDRIIKNRGKWLYKPSKCRKEAKPEKNVLVLNF